MKYLSKDEINNLMKEIKQQTAAGKPSKKDKSHADAKSFAYRGPIVDPKVFATAKMEALLRARGLTAEDVAAKAEEYQKARQQQ